MQNATPTSLPSSLFARSPGMFPSRGSAHGGALEARWNGSLDCTRRLKRDQKEAPGVARNANVYAWFCAVVRTQGHVYRSEGEGEEHLRTHAPVSRVSVAKEEDRLPGTLLDSRDPETRVKPSSR